LRTAGWAELIDLVRDLRAHDDLPKLATMEVDVTPQYLWPQLRKLDW